MPATTTLSTTTLSQNVSASAGAIKVASTSGIVPDLRLFVDGESMRVIGFGVDTTTDVKVRRGQDGTVARAHEKGDTVYLAQGHQLYTYDPQGAPPDVILVSPHINLQNGAVWFARGGPSSSAKRWWQKQAPTVTTGPLGVQSVTFDPTTST